MPKVIHHGFKPGGYQIIPIQEYSVAAWCPTEDGSGPATQVHLELTVRGFPAPLVLRFTGPVALDLLIEQLMNYRNEIWPEAIPPNPDGSPASKEDQR